MKLKVTSLRSDIMKEEGFKIGACDWVLGKLSDPGAFAVAKQLGLDGVQVSLGTAGNNMHLRNPEMQKKFLAESKKYGVQIASLAIDLNYVPYKSDSRTEKWVADSIDVCRALGTKVVLLAFFIKGDLRGDHKGTDEVVRRLIQNLCPIFLCTSKTSS